MSHFIGVDFSGSTDVFYFDSGFAIANGLVAPAPLIDEAEAIIAQIQAG